MTDGSKKTTKTRANERRDTNGVRTASKGRSRPEAVAQGHGDSQDSGSGVREGQPGSEEQALTTARRTVAEQGAREDARYSAGGNTSLSGADSAAERSGLISRRGKERLLKALDGVIIIGVVLSVAVGIMVLHAQKDSNNRNHSDTINAIKQIKKSQDLQNRITICMLEVPQPQRTANLESDCRKSATATENTVTTNQDIDDIITTPTQAIGTTGGTNTSPKAPVSTPTSSVTPATTPSPTGGSASTSGSSPDTVAQPVGQASQSGLVERIIQVIPDTVNKLL